MPLLQRHFFLIELDSNDAALRPAKKAACLQGRRRSDGMTQRLTACKRHTEGANTSGWWYTYPSEKY